MCSSDLPEKVVFCVDNDSAGKHFIEKIKSILPENLTDKMEILLPDKKDWNEDIKEKKHLQEKEEIQETLNLIKCYLCAHQGWQLFEFCS